jgi:glycerol-3-phosphate acyltransferase PlsY
MTDVLTIATGYLLGSIPFAFLLARRRGVDLRDAGSGNVGAANVLRTSGIGAAILAMVLDAMKGAAAVLVARQLGSAPATTLMAGLASIIGHIHPVWLRFRGGKGVATAAGVFGVITPGALAIACAVFVMAVWLTRFVSVGSMAGAATLAMVVAFSGGPVVVAAAAAFSAALIIYHHRPNVLRLLAGTERRLGQSDMEAPSRR